VSRLIDLRSVRTWSPATLLVPDPATLWPHWRWGLRPFGDLVAFVPVDGPASPEQAVVTPGVIDPRTGAIMRTRRGFLGPIRWVHQGHSTGLRPGDLLVPQRGSGHVVLVSADLAGFVFSSTFAALRPVPDGLEALWLWAVLNSSAGVTARTRLAEGTGLAGLSLSRLLELPVPLSPPGWAEVRMQVSELHQRVVRTRPTDAVGQSWWRIAELPRQQRWDLLLATPRPELLAQGMPLGKLAEDIKVGRRINKSLGVPRPSWLPALTAEDLRRHGQPQQWTPDLTGVVAEPDDIAVAEVGRRGPAAVLHKRTVIGAGVVVVRLHDPSLAQPIVTFLNSEPGQSLRGLLVSGVAIPHFGPRALRDLRIPPHVLGHPPPAEASKPDLVSALDGLLWT
jgi:hypothetical protein